MKNQNYLLEKKILITNMTQNCKTCMNAQKNTCRFLEDSGSNNRVLNSWLFWFNSKKDAITLKILSAI